MNLEKRVKDYLRNKKYFKKAINENISCIHEELSQFKAGCYPDIKEIVQDSNHVLRPSKNNSIQDQTALAFFRYQELTKNYAERQNELLNEKIELLEYLTDLKCFYDSIDFQIIKLEPRNRISIEIFTNGGKIDQIAAELECSYNTARVVLNSSVKSIIKGIDINLIRSVSSDVKDQ